MTHALRPDDLRSKPTTGGFDTRVTASANRAHDQQVHQHEHEEHEPELKQEEEEAALLHEPRTTSVRSGDRRIDRDVNRHS
jgi:hypothetical protein